jgi:hypothetical protein
MYMHIKIIINFNPMFIVKGNQIEHFFLGPGNLVLKDRIENVSRGGYFYCGKFTQISNGDSQK